MILILICLASLLSCRFWERKLHLDAMIRAKNQAERSRPKGGVCSNALDRRSASGAREGGRSRCSTATIGRMAEGQASISERSVLSTKSAAAGRGPLDLLVVRCRRIIEQPLYLLNYSSRKFDVQRSCNTLEQFETPLPRLAICRV